MAVKVFRLAFEGKRAICISFKEVITKLWAKYNEALLLENRLKLVQMESYRATLNHEMRAPIETSKQTIDDFLKLLLSD